MIWQRSRTNECSADETNECSADEKNECLLITVIFG